MNTYIETAHLTPSTAFALLAERMAADYKIMLFMRDREWHRYACEPEPNFFQRDALACVRSVETLIADWLPGYFTPQI